MEAGVRDLWNPGEAFVPECPSRVASEPRAEDHLDGCGWAGRDLGRGCFACGGHGSRAALPRALDWALRIELREPMWTWEKTASVLHQMEEADPDFHQEHIDFELVGGIGVTLARVHGGTQKWPMGPHAFIGSDEREAPVLGRAGEEPLPPPDVRITRRVKPALPPVSFPGPHGGPAGEVGYRFEVRYCGLTRGSWMWQEVSVFETGTMEDPPGVEDGRTSKLWVIQEIFKVGEDGCTARKGSRHGDTHSQGVNLALCALCDYDSIRTMRQADDVDATIPEPLGGAHRDVDLMAERIKEHVIAQLDSLQEIPLADLLEKRYQRLMSYGN